MDVQFSVFPILLLLLVVVWLSYRSKAEPVFPNNPNNGKSSVKDAYHSIEPIHDFDWETTPPIQLRPFKPTYHLTMAIENMALSDLIAMDSTYLTRKRLRSTIMNDHPAATLQCNTIAAAAVMELYAWMFATYLPSRFPSIFEALVSPLPCVRNTISGEVIPLNPSVSPVAALRTLGEQVDTDFLVLLPRKTIRPQSDETSIYHLEAFVTCFPSGFKTLTKLGLPLSAIHAPVPGYAAKLERSMDRFFARLPLGKVAGRANWSITTDDVLFAQEGNHLHVEDPGMGTGPDIAAEKNRALVFAFKTYQYTLQEIKDSGDGPALADAIEGLGKGNVPEMTIYKRQVIWGEEACRFLRAQ